jgi:hypothetical protein
MAPRPIYQGPFAGGRAPAPTPLALAAEADAAYQAKQAQSLEAILSQTGAVFNPNEHAKNLTELQKMFSEAGQVVEPGLLDAYLKRVYAAQAEPALERMGMAPGTLGGREAARFGYGRALGRRAMLARRRQLAAAEGAARQEAESYARAVLAASEGDDPEAKAAFNDLWRRHGYQTMSDEALVKAEGRRAAAEARRATSEELRRRPDLSVLRTELAAGADVPLPKGRRPPAKFEDEVKLLTQKPGYALVRRYDEATGKTEWKEAKMFDVQPDLNLKQVNDGARTIIVGVDPKTGTEKSRLAFEHAVEETVETEVDDGRGIVKKEVVVRDVTDPENPRPLRISSGTSTKPAYGWAKERDRKTGKVAWVQKRWDEEKRDWVVVLDGSGNPITQTVPPSAEARLRYAKAPVVKDGKALYSATRRTGIGPDDYKTAPEAAHQVPNYTQVFEDDGAGGVRALYAPEDQNFFASEAQQHEAQIQKITADEAIPPEERDAYVKFHTEQAAAWRELASDAAPLSTAAPTAAETVTDEQIDRAAAALEAEGKPVTPEAVKERLNAERRAP